jgi:hypothetical protein
MQLTQYNAFGYILAKINVDQGEIVVDDASEHIGNTILISRPYDPNFTKQMYTPKAANHIWLLTEGSISLTNLYTGATKMWNEGYSSLDDPMSVGFWSSIHEEDSTMFCFSPKFNLEKTPVMPNVSVVSMLAGESINIEEQYKLFLCSGEISVNGTAVVGPKQVIISSGKTITAASKVYGFKFN